MSTTPSSTGMSRLDTAFTVSEPSPARPKTVSVTTAPPTSSPNSRPAMVIAGRSELRSTSRQKMRASLAPRARTTCTNGWARTSSMERISTCISGAAMGTARVSVGRISPSSGVGSTTLTQPRRKEKNCSSKMAIQNPGRDTMNDGRARTALRSAPAPGRVATYAVASATTMAKPTDVAASANVCGAASVIRSNTGVPDATE